jgi:ribonucleoside-diphosphate reductase alpha chain
MIETIVKRNGKVVAFDEDKVNSWAEWACEDAIGISWSMILSNAIKAGYDGMTSEELQQALINACVSLIPSNSEYEKPAAKLFLANLRKRVFGTYQPPKFSDFYNDMVERGLWADMGFSQEKLDVLDRTIDHERDKDFPYSGLRQMSDKYLMRNIVSGELYETPQMLYMGLAMAGITNDEPIEDVVDFYNALSKLKANLPTPILLGLRTKIKGFASCCVIAGGDSVESLDAAEHVAYTMVSNRAGIGIDIETRAIREPVKGGLVEHQGKLPYYKWIDRAVKANTQQARGGSATMQFAIFDPEVMTLLRLRSQRVAEDKRIDTMDFSLAISNYFLSKLTKGQKIALISPYYAREAHDLFYTKDQKGFISAYESAVEEWKDKKVIKTKTGFESPVKWVEAKELFSVFMQQRADTGRIYCVRVDDANRRSTFKDSIRSSNLCQEILLPTAPFNHILDLYEEYENGYTVIEDENGVEHKLDNTHKVTLVDGTIKAVIDLEEGDEVQCL